MKPNGQIRLLNVGPNTSVRGHGGFGACHNFLIDHHYDNDPFLKNLLDEFLLVFTDVLDLYDVIGNF